MTASQTYPPQEGFVVTHFLVVSDQDRSRDYYRTLLDGDVIRHRDPVILKVANTWLILNEGGGPTDDKPTITLTTPGGTDEDQRVPQRACGRHRVGVPPVVGRGR